MQPRATQIPGESKQPTKVALVLIFLLSCTIFFRAASLEELEMLDPTEARYATVAQEMIFSGDWITPKIPSLSGYIPYLGKPPLHFWLTAISFEIFGMDEWAARVPSFLALMVMLISVYLFVEEFFDKGSGIIAALVTISSCLLFFFAGSSITDVTLGACVALIMLGFARCANAKSDRARIYWGLLCFLGAGLGFLTKGPVAFALGAIPVFFWCVLQRNITPLKKLPWLGGLSLLILIVVPWFITAEEHNPGFIRYFFVNENFGRYLVHEYGDRYGSGHEYPRGSVWWMMLVSSMPWSILVLITIAAAKREIWDIRRSSTTASWAIFALLWGLSPTLFFSLVRQLHPAYVVPGIPGIAIWITYLLTTTPENSRSRQLGQSFIRIIAIGCPYAILLFAVAAIVVSWRYSVAAYAFIPLIFAMALRRFILSTFPSQTLQIGYVSSVLVSLFTAVLIIASPFVSESQSAESILQYVLDHTSEEVPTVAVIRARNYSPWYLERAAKIELGSNFKLIGVEPDQIQAISPRNIIVTSSEAKLIPEDVRGKYLQSKKIGNWIWYQRISLMQP